MEEILCCFELINANPVFIPADPHFDITID